MSKPKFGLIAFLVALATGLSLASGAFRLRRKKKTPLHEWGC